MSTRAPKILMLVILLVGLLMLALPALAQEPHMTPLATLTALADDATLAPEITPVVNDPGNSPDETPIPSGLWAVFSGYYQAAVNQFTNTIRDVSLTQFGLLMAAFCVLLLGFFKYVAPLIPKDALNIVREASKDGLEVAKVELDRRHEEAKKTESPYDDAVIESLKLLHGAMTAVVNITTSLAQAVAQQQVQAQPVATPVTSTGSVSPASGGTTHVHVTLPPGMSARAFARDMRSISSAFDGPKPRAVISEPADVARQEAEAAVAQANEALEMTEVDDLDYGDARG